MEFAARWGVNQVVSNLCRETVAAGEMQAIAMVSEWSAFRPIERMTDDGLTVHARLLPPWSERGSIAGY